MYLATNIKEEETLCEAVSASPPSQSPGAELSSQDYRYRYRDERCTLYSVLSSDTNTVLDLSPPSSMMDISY